MGVIRDRHHKILERVDGMRKHTTVLESLGHPRQNPKPKTQNPGPWAKTQTPLARGARGARLWLVLLHRPKPLGLGLVPVHPQGWG